MESDGKDCERWKMMKKMENKRVKYIDKVMKEDKEVEYKEYMKMLDEKVSN